LQKALSYTPIIGDLASDQPEFKKTFILNNYKIEDQVVVAVGIYGNDAVVTRGALGGWKPYGPPRKITQSSRISYMN